MLLLEALVSGYDGAFGGHGRRRAKHGTNSGYQAHVASKTEPCQPCRDARSRYVREYRLKRLGRFRETGLGWPA